MKKIKLKKKRKFKYRIILYLFLVILGYQISYNLIMSIKLKTGNDNFIKMMLVDSNYHMLYEKKADNLLNKLLVNFLDINKPVTILENTFHVKANNISNMSYVSNPKKENQKKDPLVYIYNSHQNEQYTGKGLSEYNISPGVMMASYIFENRLEKINIETKVMEDNIIDYMNLNNMKHSQSYIASRYFIEKTIKETSSLKLIIDLHRDSIPKEKATTIINNKSCAKITFVIGNEYDTYEENLNMTKKLNNMIKEKYPSLTKDILIKGGKGNNGIYNQDLSPKMFTLEIGTDTSTIEEVQNTIEIITPIIGEFVNGT